MEEVTIKIKCENAAFKDNIDELSRILRNLADKIEAGNCPHYLMDINGNCVGTFETDIDHQN